MVRGVGAAAATQGLAMGAALGTAATQVHCLRGGDGVSKPPRSETAAAWVGETALGVLCVRALN